MQIKNSFDKESLIKIGKGALIAMSAGAGLALVDFIGTIEIDSPVVASLIVVLTPTIVNAIKEWRAGK